MTISATLLTYNSDKSVQHAAVQKAHVKNKKHKVLCLCMYNTKANGLGDIYWIDHLSCYRHNGLINIMYGWSYCYISIDYDLFSRLFLCTSVTLLIILVLLSHKMFMSIPNLNKKLNKISNINDFIITIHHCLLLI